MKTPLRIVVALLILLAFGGASSASAQVFTGVVVKSDPAPVTDLATLRGQIGACLVPPATQSAQQTQAICASLMLSLMAIVQQLSHHTAPTQNVPVTVTSPSASMPAKVPASAPFGPVAPQRTDPYMEVASTSLETALLNFYNMPPQTRVILMDAATGNRVPSSGDSLLGLLHTGYVSFPMHGEYAGRSFRFRAENASTSELVVLSPVFAVPKPAGSSEIGTYTLYDGEIILMQDWVTKSSAESRCIAEKAAHPTRNTRCTWNGASIVI